MSDFDTRRVGEIAMLEDTIRALQDQVKKMSAATDKWEPKVSSGMELTSVGGRVTMAFGGRTLAVQLPIQNLQNGDATSLTTSVLEAFAKNLIQDQLRPVIQPEVERLIANANSLTQVSKW